MNSLPEYWSTALLLMILQFASASRSWNAIPVNLHVSKKTVEKKNAQGIEDKQE